MKNKTTKRALLSSVLSLFLCFVMLLGTTFAWFTDSVTSANNVITSGNLDVVLEYKTNWTDDWATVDATTKLFNENALYEPGYTEIVFLRVSNAGSLALKYNLTFNLTNEVAGTNVNGESFMLSDYLEFGSYRQDEYAGEFNYADTLMPFMFGSREAAISNANMVTLSEASPELATGAPVLVGDKTAQVFALVMSMPTTVGNEANAKTGTVAPSFDFGVSLIATQFTEENDSFGNNYDAEAILPDVITSTTELATALTANEKDIYVALSYDVNLPISSLGNQTPGSGEYKLGGEDTETIVIDLNGHKLNVTTSYWSAIGAVNPDATIIIKDGTMTSSQATGTWNSYDLSFANCNYQIENVVFEKAIAFTNEGKNVYISDVTVNETNDYYSMWITAEGQNVTIDGLTINSAGRGIKIDEQYVTNPAKVTVNVSNATFKTVKKAAIVVKSAAGADITVNNVNIAGTVDTVHTVWVDEDATAYADLVTVTGGEMANEGEVAINAADLQEKLNNATGTATIELVNKITGNVTVTQKPDVKITVEGNGQTIEGTVTVDGKSATYTTAGITIKNVKFIADSVPTEACINMGVKDNNNTRYICNLTVEDCFFNVPGAVAVKSYGNGDKALTIKGCTVSVGMHSLVQVNNVDSVVIENCEVYSKNGINVNQSPNVTITGCTVDVFGYAVRFGASGGDKAAVKNYVIDSCTLKAACQDAGDAVVVLRATCDNATLTITNTTIADSDIINNSSATIIK